MCHNNLLQIVTIINKKTAVVLGLSQEAPIWMIVPTDLETVISSDAVHEEHAQLEKLWSSLSRRVKFCSIISLENKDSLSQRCYHTYSFLLYFYYVSLKSRGQAKTSIPWGTDSAATLDTKPL